MPPRPYDPLIGYDFSSWMDRLKDVIKRSWANVLKLLVVGAVLPAIGLILVGLTLVLGLIFLAARTVGADGSTPVAPIAIIAAILLYVGLVLGLGYLYSVTGLSVMKTIANDAAGQPVPLATVYKSSLRLGWPTLGWNALAGLVMGIGFIACILPGIYLFVALSMLLPIMAFERRNGFAGSFRLVHSNFWPAAGRIVMLYVITTVISYFVSFITQLAITPLSIAIGEEPSGAMIVVVIVAMVLVMLIQILVALLSQVVMLCGYAVTYAELRGRLDPNLTTAQLAAEANAP